MSALVFQNGGDWTLLPTGGGSLTLTGSSARYGAGQAYETIGNAYSASGTSVISVGRSSASGEPA